MEEEISLIYEELFLSGACVIGKRCKNGRWDAKTYRILKRLREIAESEERISLFNTDDGSVEFG